MHVMLDFLILRVFVLKIESNFVCVTDFEEVLNLEPGNKQALNELQKLQIVRFFFFVFFSYYGLKCFGLGWRSFQSSGTIRKR